MEGMKTQVRIAKPFRLRSLKELVHPADEKCMRFLSDGFRQLCMRHLLSSEKHDLNRYSANSKSSFR